MDETLEARKKSALYQKVLERVETILRRQNAIAAGKRQSTLTPEANDQLKKYIDSLRGGSPESKALLNRMMTYWNSYSKKDVIQGQNRPVETLDQVKDADIIEVLENPNLPLPQRVKDAMGDQLHSLDEMNAQQLIGVLRNIDQIENDGRIELRAEKEAQAAENERKAWEAADEVAGALVPQMSKVEAYKRATKKENQSSRQRTKEDAKTVWEKLFFGNIMAEMLIEGLAGFKPNSVFKRSVFTPIKKGVDAKLRGIKGAVEAFRDRYQGIDIEDARLTPLGRYTVKEYGENGQVTRSLTRTLTIENGMFVYAHAQNPSGLAHLYGTGLDEDVISTIIKDLPQKYKDAVDDQIDYYDTVQYPKMNEVFRAVNNIDMPKEERYFPINALDTNRAENTFLLDMIARLSTRASAVQKGMVKARVNSQAPFRSLSYFDTVTNNLLMTEHYVAMEQPIQQANRVLNHPAFRTVMREKSPVRLDLLRKWVNRMALGKVSISENDTHLTSILDKLRRNYAVFQLSLKIPSMIVQLSSGIRALAYVKPKYIQRALGKAFGELAPRSVDGKLVWPLMDFIHERSPSMENRMADYERELAEWAEKGIQRRILRTPVSGKRGAVTRVMERASSAYATAQEFTMWPMGAIDKGVASTIWMGKYLESLDSGMDENAAIEAADEVIRKTQSGGGLIALPENFAGSWLLRALSQFKSDPMKGLNLLYELASTAKEKGAVATTGTALVAFMLPAVFAYIVQHGGGLPWDEPEEWGKELVGSVTGGVPVFNALIESAMIGAGNVSKRLRGVKPGPGFEPKALDIPGLTGLLNIEKGLSKGKADKIAEGLIEIFGVPMGSQGLRLAESFTDPLTGDWREYIWSDYMLKQETVETTMIKKALSSKREDAKELAQYINKLEPNEKERFRVMVQIEEANRLLKKIEKAVVEKKIPKAVADTRRRLVKDRIRELKGKL
jgi:hypothetical protein